MSPAAGQLELSPGLEGLTLVLPSTAARVPVALFATDVSFEIVSVEGASMTVRPHPSFWPSSPSADRKAFPAHPQPTLNPNWAESRVRDWILLNKWHRTWGKPWTRGDVVTLWSVPLLRNLLGPHPTLELSRP